MECDRLGCVEAHVPRQIAYHGKGPDYRSSHFPALRTMIKPPRAELRFLGTFSCQRPIRGRFGYQTQAARLPDLSLGIVSSYDVLGRGGVWRLRC